MNRRTLLLGCLLTFVPRLLVAAEMVEVPVDVIQDKIRGGLLGQILGDLNGLKHEFKYIADPGNVTEYTPALPQGAVTDDDTDFEWVYIVAMQKAGTTLLPSKDIPALWKAHINRAIWCANQYARQLMDLGMEPPLTGQIHFNPWSDFNIAGQFTCETYGLLCPGMPQTAGRIGLNYIHAAVAGEPAQTTQLFEAMIATAFLTDNLNAILDAGVSAVDPKSAIRELVQDVRAWHKQNPDNWRETRRLVKQKYARFNMAMRDKNGYELNTASIIAALLYGQGDFVKTAVAAFNFGWDADCNAATACTIVGVIKGYRWMQTQCWDIRDQFRNTTRDNMPMDETITSFGDRLIALAERVITEQGGAKTTKDGKAVYRIAVQKPANVEPLPNVAQQFKQLQAQLAPQIESGLLRSATTQEQARACYMAICLDLALALKEKHPAAWAKALEALTGYPKVVSVLFHESPTPAGNTLCQRALAAGLKKPEKAVKIW